ncbi:MAG: metallophosphoesterase [Breznakibacter sp.]|nr:metallophosphoesterase [Breznakibacter sp.]
MNQAIIKAILIIFPYFILFSCNAQTPGQEMLTTKKAMDGPYLLYNNDHLRMIYIDEAGKISDAQILKPKTPYTFEVHSQEGNHHFGVTLHPIKTQPAHHHEPAKIFVVSDPHGDFDSFVAILRAGKVINDQYEWIWGKNHLVVLGDAFDRGVDVLPILWLCYKLDAEAPTHGGLFHFLIGNHEDLVLAGDKRYMEEKYTRLERDLTIPYQELFSAQTELGQWLRAKNCAITIGKNLFIHAGLSQSILDREKDLQVINNTMQEYLGVGKKNMANKESLPYALFSSNGPLWYRGMVRDDDKYEKIDEETIKLIRKTYQVERVIVGHTIFDDITSFYNQQVIAINVKNRDNRLAGKGRAILIENNQVFVVYDNGELKTLE